MKTYAIALAAASAMVPAGALAKPLSKEAAENKANYTACMRAGNDPADCRWHQKFDDCLLIDNRGPNHDGEQFCAKSGKGMTQKQIDAWYADDAKKTAAEMHAKAEPGYKNCMRELDDAKRLGVWYGPPSREDCIAWAEALRQKGIDMTDEGLKGLMESK